jgi:putative redox protein
MITIKSSYLGNLRTKDIHLKSGETIITDAPTDNNGKGEAFSPTDLTSASLCSCMMTIMGIKANKMNVILEGLEADVTKFMADNPRKISKIQIDFRMEYTDASAEQLEFLKKSALSCPVALSLHPEIEQKITFQF